MEKMEEINPRVIMNLSGLDMINTKHSWVEDMRDPEKGLKKKEEEYFPGFVRGEI